MFYSFSLWHRQSKKIYSVLLGNVIFRGGVGNFDLHFLSHFFPKQRCFCAHQTGNFLNFPKLTLLLPVVHFQGVLWAFKDKSPFFLGHPVLYLCVLLLDIFPLLFIFRYCVLLLDSGELTEPILVTTDMGLLSVATPGVTSITGSETGETE